MEKLTKQRAAIREAVAQSQRPLLPQEILESAQPAVPGLGIATVYRNLKAMVDDGLLRTVDLPGQNTRYELAAHGHHHHFQCRGCDRVFDIYACPGDLSNLAPPGFRVEAHAITLYGQCGDCARQSGL